MTDATDGTRRGVPKPRITAQAWTCFLDALAETTNVVLAAKRAGISHGAAYYRHRRDAAFAAQWRAALMAGYDRLESAMIRHALGEPFEPVVAGGEGPAGPLDVDLAMKLLARHHATVVDGAQTKDRAHYRADRATASKTLVAKLKAYERRLETPGKAT